MKRRSSWRAPGKEPGSLDVFRLILATGIAAFLIGVTLAAASREEWVVN
jgi:hypothetical protein